MVELSQSCIGMHAAKLLASSEALDAPKGGQTLDLAYSEELAWTVGRKVRSGGSIAGSIGEGDPIASAALGHEGGLPDAPPQKEGSCYQWPDPTSRST